MQVSLEYILLILKDLCFLVFTFQKLRKKLQISAKLV